MRLPKIFSDDAMRSIVAAANRIAGLAVQKDFTMPEFETPRKIGVVNGMVIRRNSEFLWKLYNRREIRRALEKIVGVEVFPCSHPYEYMVLNLLQGQGATHGWHFDDPALAVVIIIDAPKAQEGGVLEFVKNDSSIQQKSIWQRVQSSEKFLKAMRAMDLIRQEYHVQHDVYLLRADKCFHRVTPLVVSNARRLALNFAYETCLKTEYGDTANRLYDMHDEELNDKTFVC